MNFNTLEKLNKKLILSIFLVSVIVFCSGFSGVGKFWYNLTSKNIKLVQQGKFPVDTVHNKYILLPDDRIVCIGASKYTGTKDGIDIYTVQIYNPQTNEIKVAGKLKNDKPIGGYSAVALKDGRILITGGGGTNRAEIFNPDTGESKVISGMNYSRNSHKSILLKNGKVLIMGGWVNKDIGRTRKTEIFDPKTEKFNIGPEMNYERMRISAILLDNGNVFIPGGDRKLNRLNEIYDVKTNKFLISGKNYCSSYGIKLKDNKVFAHYHEYTRKFNHKQKADIYDIKKDELTVIENPLRPIIVPTNLLLTQKNDVMLVGGTVDCGISGRCPTDIVRVYNPETEKFRKLGELSKKEWIKHIFYLKNGKIAVCFLYDTIHIYKVNNY